MKIRRLKQMDGIKLITEITVFKSKLIEELACMCKNVTFGIINIITNIISMKHIEYFKD